MTFTAHGTKDICKHCGRNISYDSDDGYWWCTAYYTPFNCRIEDRPHEPTNHPRNIRWFYCTNESLK